jgi:hypothetical protein
MPLKLEKARLVLPRSGKRSKYIRVFNNYRMAWFFEPTSDPNMEYEIVLRYDGKELTVAKVQAVRIEPLALTDITKLWRGNPVVEGVIERVRNTLELH